MRQLIHKDVTVNQIRLLLLRDARCLLHAVTDAFPDHSILLCTLLKHAVPRLAQINTTLYAAVERESFNLRAYLAQELEDGHSLRGERNMDAYLWHAGFVSKTNTAAHQIANMARAAWLDKMLDTLTNHLAREAA